MFFYMLIKSSFNHVFSSNLDIQIFWVQTYVQFKLFGCHLENNI